MIKDIIEDEINEKGNYLRRGTGPKFSDIEVIALSLTADCLSMGSENQISRRQYNDGRKLLFERTEGAQK